MAQDALQDSTLAKNLLIWHIWHWVPPRTSTLLRILQHFMLQSQAENHQAAEWAAKQGKAIGPFSTATSASL